MFKFKKNQKGFTLIELLIVVAIIAILAAIAIPQFSQYRIRGYNASANTDIRNARTSEEALFADWQRYGAAETAARPGDPGSGGAGGAMCTGPTGPANSTILTLTDAGGAPRGLPFALGNNVTLQAKTDASFASYIMESKHISGDTVYAADSDSTTNLRVSNSATVAQNVTAAAVEYPASTAGAVDLTDAAWISM